MYHKQKLSLHLLLCQMHSYYDKRRKENYSKTTLLWHFLTICCLQLNLRRTQNHQIQILSLSLRKRAEPLLPMAKKKRGRTGQLAQVPTPNADRKKRPGLTLKRLTRTWMRLRMKTFNGLLPIMGQMATAKSLLRTTNVDHHEMESPLSQRLYHLPLPQQLMVTQ